MPVRAVGAGALWGAGLLCSAGDAQAGQGV